MEPPLKQSGIIVKGAREHNLQNIDLVLPKNSLICLTGVSGSGKSSLAFDTLYAEGHRRYLESLSTFARQFIGQLPKPDVDLIHGLSPAISISQKASAANPRSTVGTLTEIYDYLRLLYARLGEAFCPVCHGRVTAQSRDEIIRRLAENPPGTQVMILAPVARGQKGTHRQLLQDLQRQGFLRVRLDGHIRVLAQVGSLDARVKHDVDVVVDDFRWDSQQSNRLASAVQTALQVGQGVLIARIARAEGSPVQPREVIFAEEHSCPKCRIDFPPLSPQLFSFNSPHGMCRFCEGLGTAVTFQIDSFLDPEKSFMKSVMKLLRSPDFRIFRESYYYYSLLEQFEKALRQSGDWLNKPWKELLDFQRKVILYGSYGDPRATADREEEVVGLAQILRLLCTEKKSAAATKVAEKYIREGVCPVCQGDRLNGMARLVRLTAPFKEVAESGLTLPQLCRLPITDAAQCFQRMMLDDGQRRIAAEVVKEVQARLGFLVDVGLGYLTLDRPAPSLSGGESQRIRLASQIGSGLVGVLYVLDEPSIGLHARDNQRLLSALCRLRDLGNTVVVVEHDEETMRAADWIVDFGPAAGRRGGRVVAAGTLHDVCSAKESITGEYLAGRRRITVPEKRRPGNGKVLRVVGAAQNNLKNITVEFPLATFICVTGVSGSGKSSLVNDILIEALNCQLNNGNGSPGKFERLEGLEHLDKMIAIDQSPIGRTPRSNPGTYVKAFDEIRKLFSQLPEARRRGFAPGRFSFNVDGGRCPACEGNGATLLEMDFLADVWLPCPVCQGKRFNRETLQVRYKGHSIADVLEMEVELAEQLFENIPAIRNKLATLKAIGLDYLQIGQPSPTLSGGEAQRIKLARELSKRATGRTIYLLDEPTTGLHFADIERLLDALHRLVDAGNTVVVVEHNMDVIKTADWIIDLGPEGGQEGGYVVAAGTPEHVAACPHSYTGWTLRSVLGLDNHQGQPTGPSQQHAMTSALSADRSGHNGQPLSEIRIRGANQHNLKNVELAIPRGAMTAFCGPSGSGKTSLAMDTLYAEGQRRYVESLSTYARQYVSQMPKPQVEHIEGLSPAVAIEQKTLPNNPRSTVGTVTEIYDYLRVLFARLGTPHCPACHVPVGTQTADQIVDQILAEPEGTFILILAPLKTDSSTNFDAMWAELRAEGFVRVRINATTYSLESVPKLARRQEHEVEVVVDRCAIRASDRSRLTESVETALGLGEGCLRIAYVKENWPEPRWPVVFHNVHMACRRCGRSFEPLQPNNFSFNTPLGWCPACEGLGVYTGIDPDTFVRFPSSTLVEGAVGLWPNLSHPWASAMLHAVCEAAGIPESVPYEKLSVRHRRLLWFGTGDQWYEIRDQPSGKVLFRFQYCGMKWAVEQAAKKQRDLAAYLQVQTKERVCLTCEGSRLRDDAAAVRFAGKTIQQICQMPLGRLAEEVAAWKRADGPQRVGDELLREIGNRLQFLLDVGLDYLTLDRPASTLSNGEAQRIRLARQLGSGLCGVLYVLDEPTVGLHPRDNRRLIGALHKLRDLGNTLVVVEHDREVIAASDTVVDFGPGAGHCGGQVIAQAAPADLPWQPTSVTGPYLTGAKKVVASGRRRLKVVGPVGIGQTAVIPLSDVEHINDIGPCSSIVIRGARHNNLKDITVELPLGAMTAVTGPSGSGKSSLIHDVLYTHLARKLHQGSDVPGACDSVELDGQVDKVILVDQRPIGLTPQSTPATYTGVFTPIREIFARQPEAREQFLSVVDFSFNSGNGRCSACQGQGQRRIEMHFLPDVWVTCPACQGTRYGPAVLAVRYRGKTISDVLQMTCAEAREFFADVPAIRRRLDVLCDVGLGYLTLGQPANTLSGGESQRIKLAAELAAPTSEHTLYLLDEPTTGLHFEDIQRLLDVLQRLVNLGHTVIIIEHNLDVIKACDWVVDLGPDAGEKGGHLVAAGPPEHIAQWARRAVQQGGGLPSATGEFLAEVLTECCTPSGAAPSSGSAAIEPALKTSAAATQTAHPDQGHLSAAVGWQRGQSEHPTEPHGGFAWDMALLHEILDQLMDTGLFESPRWTQPNCVEVYGKGQTTAFLRAITCQPQALCLNFRVIYNGLPVSLWRAVGAERTRTWSAYDTGTLEAELDEDELDAMVRSRFAWEELRVNVTGKEQLESDAFEKFLIAAIRSYQAAAEMMAHDYRNDVSVISRRFDAPWKWLRHAWHISRRGFPQNTVPRWPQDLIRRVLDLLMQTFPEGYFVWEYSDRVEIRPPDHRIWFQVWTKNPELVQLNVYHGEEDVGIAVSQSSIFEESHSGQYFQCQLRSIEEWERKEDAIFSMIHTYQKWLLSNKD